jgi:ubiquinone/menaquinone biosynthesis C-methylase UbiE
VWLGDETAWWLVIRAVGQSAARVLEPATATAITSRPLRNDLPVTAELVVAVLNAPMPEVARARFDPAERVAFAQLDVLKLDFPDAFVNQVVGQFGGMFLTDKVRSFGDVARTLRPGSRFVFKSWGTLAESPFARLAQDVDELIPADPRGFDRLPFGLRRSGENVGRSEPGRS